MGPSKLLFVALAMVALVATSVAHAEGLEQAKAAVAVATSPAASTQKLPPAPEGSNINMKILADHLYKLMPGFLLLHQHTRIRKAKPLEDMERRLSERCDACTAVGREFCTCSDRHEALVAQKACAASMFAMPKKYQKATLLDVLLWNVLKSHPNKAMAVLLLALKERTLAVSMFGDTHLCEASSEQQEHAVVGVLKKAVNKRWASDDSATSRSRLLSALLVQEEQTTAASMDAPGRQKSVGLAQHDKEEVALQAMRPAAAAVVDDIVGRRWRASPQRCRRGHGTLAFVMRATPWWWRWPSWSSQRRAAPVWTATATRTWRMGRTGMMRRQGVQPNAMALETSD